MAHGIKDRELVRSLRKKGYSLNQIVKEARIPKSTIRGWIADLTLTPEQRTKLRVAANESLQSGRINAQKKFRQIRSLREKELYSEGKKETEKLTQRELFLAGIALYWAEGFKNKYEKRLGFCNSDPNMIKFYIYWLEKALGVSRDQITARLSINVTHKERESEILNFWVQATGVPTSSFTKTFYQNSVTKKRYEDRNKYFGVLRLHVKESLDHLLKMRGWIAGLSS